MSYWDNICSLQIRQTTKGIQNYGQTIEQNQVPEIVERITMLEEELIDGLMYCEWIKDKLGAGSTGSDNPYQE